MTARWWSIEVADAAVPAAGWRRAHGEALVEAALTHGAVAWEWVRTPWGEVLEVAFPDPVDWARFRDLPGVRAALDAVPDPIRGLFIYPGRGGSAGGGHRRRPRRPMGAGAAPLPESAEALIVSRDTLVEPAAGPR